MILIEYYFAMMIFKLYRERFEGMDKVSDLKEGHEILLPHGVKLTKNKGKYYVKTYSGNQRDFIMFGIGMGVDISKAYE